MEKKEYAVGEEFLFGETRLKCVKEQGLPCTGCFFDIEASCSNYSDQIGYCAGYWRTDNTDVIFVEVK